MATEFEYVVKRIAELREELEDLVDDLDLLEARARNFGKKRYSTDQVKKMLGLK
jgi:cell division protein FtsB